MKEWPPSPKEIETVGYVLVEGENKRNNKIHNFSSHSLLKASVVERFNWTLKEKMWKYFFEVNNHCWIDVIEKLMTNYNNSFHRSIKMTSVEGSNKKYESKVRKTYILKSINRVENINIGQKI